MTPFDNRTGGFILLLMCGLLSGCFHQQKVPALAPAAKTPNIYVPPPVQAQLPPMESEPPPDVTNAKPVEAEEEKPKRRVKRPATQPATGAVSTPPTTPEAPASEPAKLGALGSGGDSNSRVQEVAGKITAIEKRVNDLPPSPGDQEQKLIAKVRLFLKEASDALKGGDVEGAGILTTKADLLLDDLTGSK